MRLGLGAYCLGNLLCILLPSVAAALTVAGGVGGLSVLTLVSPRCFGFRVSPCLRSLRLALCCFCLGMTLHATRAHDQLARQLPAALEGLELSVTGRVASLSNRSIDALEFEFLLDHVWAGCEQVDESLRDSCVGFNGRVALRYYPELSGDPTEEVRAEQPALAPGTRLDLVLKLERPRGFSNPGGFDYEAYLFRQGILARGYIRSPLADAQRPLQREAGLAQGARLRLEAIRHGLRERVKARADHLPHSGILIALGLGDGGRVSAEVWDVFRRAGATHLLVVSGLHISLFALLLLFPARALWWCGATLSPGLGRRIPRENFVLIAALSGAVLFGLVSGWDLPAQRASLMMGVVVGAKLFGRRFGAVASLLIALAAVLTLTPSAATGSGLWFSFLAVAALVFFSSSAGVRMGEPEALRHRQMRPQWVVFLALTVPLTLFGQQLSLLSPLINLCAIPLLAFLVLPSVLLAVLTEFLLDERSLVFFEAADWLCGLLVSVVSFGADYSPLWHPERPGSLATTAGLLLAVGSIVLPLAPRVRLIMGVFLLLAAFAPALSGVLGGGRSCASRPASLRMNVFDVGQGLSVLLRTPCHSLLYDAGAAWSEEFELGGAVIAPALRSLGVDSLDRVVISHPDNDHAGGLPGLLGALPVRSLMLGGRGYEDLPVGRRAEAVACREGQAWRWEGVEFRVLSPEPAAGPTGTGAERNASSCVLHVRASGLSVLLPGDIERAVERRVARKFAGELAADVLIAPHHGSNTSSSYALLKKVSPRLAIISAGYKNAFGHPHTEVLARFRRLEVSTLQTASSGMIALELGGSGMDTAPTKHRESARRYWRPRAETL